MKKTTRIVLLISVTILLLFPMQILAEEIINDNVTIDDNAYKDDLLSENKEKELNDINPNIEETKELDTQEEYKITEESNLEIKQETKKIETTNSIDNEEMPENGLPLVVIRVDESNEAIEKANNKDPNHEYGDIEAINNSEDHSVRSVGTIEIILPAGYESQYGKNDVPDGEKDLEYIRGRGNSTWGYEKKPYKFKYDKKQEILGMGENKEWALLANYMDDTLTNNAIASWMIQEFGMEYPIQMVPVEVVMIGSESGRKFLGSYYLSELVDIGNGRVELPELKKNTEDDITGGYLISLYYDSQDYDKPETTIFATSSSNLEFINENPSFETEELTAAQEKQKNYIREYVNKIDDLIVNNEVIDENTHKEIDKLLDLQSTADFWLIQEFLINFDAYKTSSNYLYKKPGEEGKLYWGPLWDFDLIYFWIGKDNPEDAIGFNNYNPNPWIDNLRDKDELFVDLLKERWKVLEPIIARVTEDGGILDQYKERQRKAWEVNYDLWMKDNHYEALDYDEEFEGLRLIIDFRRNWFNENIEKIGNASYIITYEIDGKVVKTEKVRADSYLFDIELEPEKEGYYFNGWIEKESKTKIEEIKIESDLTIIPDFINPNEIEEEIHFYLSTYEAWVSLDRETYEEYSPKIYPEEYREVLRKNIEWTSSEEKIATVEDGIAYLHSVGDVTLTGKLFNGDSKSILLHVFDESFETINEPEGIILEKDSFTIEIGEYAQIVYFFTPNKPINPDVFIDINREVDNEDIIDIDYEGCYVIKGLSEGVAIVTLEIYSAYSDRYYGTKTITVNVVNKKEESEEEDEPVVPNNNENNEGTGTVEPKKANNNTSKVVKLTNTKKEETEKDVEEETTGKEEPTKKEPTEEEVNKETKEEKEESEEENDSQKTSLIIVLVTMCIIAVLLALILKVNKYE